MFHALKPRTAAILALAISASGIANSAPAAPQITAMSIRGFQIGGTTTVTMQGSDLLPNPKLIIDVPIAEAVVSESSTATNVEWQVTVAAHATPGLYNLRLANELGISGHVIVAVDKLPQAALTERIESLPVALHASLSGSNIARTNFSGTAGQPLIVEVESQRLGGRLRPVVHLYDADRRQLDWAMPAPWLGGDTRLVTSLPADGEYTLELHDLQYAAQNPGHYRLKVGSFQFADQCFPPAAELGKTTQVTLLGNLPPDQQVAVTAAGTGGPIAVPWPELDWPTGWRPKLLSSDVPEVLEAPSSDGVQQLPDIPVAVSGRLDAAGQEDVYRIAVTEGAKLRFDLFADRIGSPMDAVLELRNEQGGRLAQNDDFSTTTDPRIDYTVPKDLQTVDVVIRDHLDRGDERCIYRLLITDEAVRRPSFRLKVSDDTHNVPSEGTKVLQVTAEREGYDGPIALSFDNLPSEVTASGTDIPAGSNGALVTLTASGLKTASIVTSIRGTSVDVDPPISAIAVFDSHALGDWQPWLGHDVAMSLAPAAAVPFRLEWGKAPEETPLVLGTTFKAPVKLLRPPGAIGPVRLTLVASEPPPLVNGNPNANLIVRAERAAVDIPLDAGVKAAFDALAAADKALADARDQADAVGQGGEEETSAAAAALTDAETKRAEAEKALQEAQSKLNNDVEFNVIVPPNLPNSVQDLAVKAELRSVDNATLLAEVYTPIRRFTPLNPLSVHLPDPAFVAKLDPRAGAVVNLRGKVERTDGFGDVTVTIAGQPGGVAAPSTVLKPGSDDFDLELKFPANFAPAQVDTIRLVATGPPNPAARNIVVRTELPIVVNILPADPAED